MAELYEEIGRLKVQLEWLKKKLRGSTDRLRALIDFDHDELSVSEQCALIGLPRSSLYYEAVPESAENLKLMRLIDEQYLKRPFFGSRQMTTWFQRQGYVIYRKRVQRLMRLMGLEAIYPGPRTSVPGKGRQVYPYLLRNLEITRPNQVWAADITYVPLAEGFLYLVAILDWYSRLVLSWRLSNSLEESFCLEALEEALRRARPEIFNTDQGVRRIVREVLTRDGNVDEVSLAMWSGRILEEIDVDDGAERRLVLVIEDLLADGTPLPPIEVPADEYAFMRWPMQCWGTRAVVMAGVSTADHLRTALQLLSGDVLRRTVFGHSGWRKLDGQWRYLHAGGAIGSDGPMERVEVQLPDALQPMLLKMPSSNAQLIEAVRASLRILDAAPDRIVEPILASVYRSVRGPADFAPFLAGPTGAGKTELATLAEQHFGAGFDPRHLPASWSSTGNSLEPLAFAAKDMLLVVDDWVPTGSTADIQRSHRDADRLLRAQGNRSGRGRCRPDGSVRSPKPPRGLILSTGEDIPRGQSLRGRSLVLELEKGELDWTRMTAAQADAAAGKYAMAMAGFLRWLAPQYGTVSDEGTAGQVRGGVRRDDQRQQQGLRAAVCSRDSDSVTIHACTERLIYLSPRCDLRLVSEH